MSLDFLVLLGDDDKEETDRAIFSSDSVGLPVLWITFSSKMFCQSLPRLASSELTLDSTTVAGKANDSGGFFTRALFPSSLNGIPTSRVAHTSQLGLQGDSRGT